MDLDTTSYSCETQLISLVQDLPLNYDKDIQTDLISMDFAKAFDTVPHCRLLRIQTLVVWCSG